MNNAWIVPCNINYFNIIEYVKTKKDVVFKKTSDVMVGDAVYIYLTAPYSQIRYMGKVIENDINEERLIEHSYIFPIGINSLKTKKYYMIRILSEYEDGDLSLHDLRKHGLPQVQRQAKACKELLSFIATKKALPT